MKTAVCYYSRHHGNTLRVLEAMAREGEIDLIDVTTRQLVRLENYDCIGFASGIYAFEFHPKTVEFLREHLPRGKRVFFVYTYGGAKGTGTRAIAQAAREKGAEILGEFGCRGYVTYGPFKLLGGAGKGRPNGEDLDRARAFFASIAEKIV